MALRRHPTRVVHHPFVADEPNPFGMLVAGTALVQLVAGERLAATGIVRVNVRRSGVSALIHTCTSGASRAALTSSVLRRPGYNGSGASGRSGAVPLRLTLNGPLFM